MSYQEALNEHLRNYKRQQLGITEPGVFKYRGRDILYEHILPIAESYRNLFAEVEPEARAFLEQYPNKRHQYFHHLNSSQAFAFNLFFPYFYGGSEAAAALLRALGQEGVFCKCQPEAVPVPEEESNIDMLWINGDGIQTFCEVKLSESDFGTATDDDEHRSKLATIYRPVLSIHLEASRLEPTAFFRAYRFNRNVWHMVRAEHNRLIFLLPGKNDVLWRQLQVLLLGVVSRTRQRISVVAIEDVIARILGDDRCPKRLREYANKLKEKYVI